MKLTDEKIWGRAKHGNPSILSDPGVSTLKDSGRRTPLHWLAWEGVKEAWFHPDFNKVKNKDGETPKDRWFLYKHKPVTYTDFING